MGIAAANASAEMMPHLARHFIEEYTHGDIYRRGLRSLFPDEVILHSQPLPSTRALVNYLNESAQRGSFAYYSGNELLQMTENTGDSDAGKSVDDFYAAMRKHYPYTDKLIDSFIAHTKADQALGHADAFLLLTVTFAGVSFLAGMSTKFVFPRHVIVIGVGCLVFIYGVVRIVELPLR